jgi:hypothetical protein
MWGGWCALPFSTVRVFGVIDPSFPVFSFFFGAGHYTEGAELSEQVLDMVRKEAEACECLQGTYAHTRMPYT